MSKLKQFAETLLVAPTQNWLLQLFRYGFVGGVAFVADYGTLIGCTEWLGIHHLVSAAIAFMVGLTVNYLMSTSWVFASHTQSNRKFEFLIFAIIGVIGLGLNELIIYAGTDLCGIDYRLSKLISTAIVFFWNFFARKLILFNKKEA